MDCHQSWVCQEPLQSIEGGDSEDLARGLVDPDDKAPLSERTLFPAVHSISLEGPGKFDFLAAS